MNHLLSRFNIDPYILMLLGMVMIATILPARGSFATLAGGLATAGIVLLFFLHGARLSWQAVIDGARHWRLHLTVATITFVMFPLLGLAVSFIPGINPALAGGLLFLTLLPSTVQSSIAFTAIARGNVAAAVCSAAFSNLAGILITPLLVAVLITGRHSGLALDSAISIALLLLLPFIAGHILRRWIGAWVARQKRMLAIVDRGSILLVVYTAFSAAMVAGLWKRVSAIDIAQIGLLCAALLFLVLYLSRRIGRRMGFNRADLIVLQFCGSKKSLASGVPMAGVLFPAEQVGAIILPLMLFHQMQLIVCAILARRYEAQAQAQGEETIASDSPSMVT